MNEPSLLWLASRTHKRNRHKFSRKARVYTTMAHSCHLWLLFDPTKVMFLEEGGLSEKINCGRLMENLYNHLHIIGILDLSSQVDFLGVQQKIV